LDRGTRTDVGEAACCEFGLVLLELTDEAKVVEQAEDVGLINGARAVSIVFCKCAPGLFLAFLGHGDQVARG
jgi:hypothetical protein